MKLVSQLDDTGSAPNQAVVDALQANLSQCVTRDAQGRPQLQLTLPDDSAITDLASTLAKLLVKS